jgi:hypothetical protein
MGGEERVSGKRNRSLTVEEQEHGERRSRSMGSKGVGVGVWGEKEQE